MMPVTKRPKHPKKMKTKTTMRMNHRTVRHIRLQAPPAQIFSSMTFSSPEVGHQTLYSHDLSLEQTFLVKPAYDATVPPDTSNRLVWQSRTHPREEISESKKIMRNAGHKQDKKAYFEILLSKCGTLNISHGSKSICSRSSHPGTDRRFPKSIQLNQNPNIVSKIALCSNKNYRHCWRATMFPNFWSPFTMKCCKACGTDDGKTEKKYIGSAVT